MKKYRNEKEERKQKAKGGPLEREGAKVNELGGNGDNNHVHRGLEGE